MRHKEPKPKKPFLSGYKTYDTSTGKGSRDQWRAAWQAMGAEEAAAVLQDEDPLAILGFSQRPSKAELGKRFRELVQKHHPDKGGDAAMFKKVYAAWSTLNEVCV